MIESIQWWGFLKENFAAVTCNGVEIPTHGTLTVKKPNAILWSIKNRFRNMLTPGQQDVGKSFSRSPRDEFSMPLRCVQHSHQPSVDREVTVPFWLLIYFLPLSWSNFSELRSISALPPCWHQHIRACAVFDGIGDMDVPAPLAFHASWKELEALEKEFWQHIHILPAFSEAGQLHADISGMLISAFGEAGRAPAVKVDCSQLIRWD